MPSPDTVLAGLTVIAHEWHWLAVTWHVLLGASVVPFLAGWRLSVCLVGCLLVGPLLSVSLTAWLAGNPFNASVFTILAGALAATAAPFPNAAARRASPALLVHFVMQREQLLGIAWRVESATGSARHQASIGETACPASHPAI